jgi:2-methylcitrate dehydratase PrpD
VEDDMLTARLADFVTKTDAIPVDVLDAAKVALADTLAVGVAGSAEEPSTIARGWLAELGGRPQATVWGHQSSAPAADAAFVNGVAGHALDFDDSLPTLRGHPSTTMVPVALAVAEAVGASGRAVLSAYAIGLEVGAKLAQALGNGHYLRGWHNTATVGVFSATTVAARLTGLDALQLRHAWGLAASQSAGLVRNFGTMTKPFHAGHAARCAVTAAWLARHGFTADPDIFDGKGSFLAAYAGDDARPLAPLLDGLASPWEALAPGVNYKRWPCCYCNHRAIGGLLEMLAEHEVRPDDVDSITIGFPPGADEALIHDDPQTGLEGKFSIQYSVAATVLDRCVTMDSFTDAMVQRPAARELMRKVRRARVPDSKIYSGTLGYTDIEIVTRRGKFARRIDRAPGSAAWPMTPSDHEEKFVDCAARVLGREPARALYALACRVDELPDVEKLVRATVPAGR